MEQAYDPRRLARSTKKSTFMDIEKILVLIEGKEYSFTVEVMHDEDETVYRVTADQGERLLEDVSPGYLEYDEHGNVQIDERVMEGQARAVTGTIWEAIKQQIPIATTAKK
jgi:hypothetical protein